MALQSSLYIPDGSTRTFPSTKHIATAQHVGVYLKLVTNSTWIPVNVTEYEVINNSIVFNTAVSAILYSTIEIRVADTQDELTDNPSDISIVATNILDVNIVADNIALLTNALNGEYIVNGLPVVASEGDLAVNVLDGGIYEWQSSAWVLIAQSASSGGVVQGDTFVPIVDGLPNAADEGAWVFNNLDGLSYVMVNGIWTNVVGAPLATDIVGIEVVPTVTALVGEYDLQVVYAQDTKKLMEWILATTSWSEVISPTGVAVEVADASITTAKFAAGLTPVEIVTELPTVSNFIGRTVYLTTDGKLYRYTATGFISTVATQDLTGTITTVQIGTGAITTPLLAAGAVTADTIGANAITAGKIAALAVTAGTIQAGAIGASEIAAGAILTDKLAAGSITATKLAANSVTAVSIATDAITSDKILANSIIAGKIAVGAVSANQITANAITSDKIAANSITATKIASYAITADKLDVNALSTARFYCSDTNAEGFYTFRNYTVTSSSAVAVGGVKSTGYGQGVYGRYDGTTSGSSAVKGISNANGTHGVYGVSASGTGVFGQGSYAIVADSSGAYGFWTAGACWFEGSAYPFTGSHVTITKEQTEVGDIVISTNASNFSINQSIPDATTSTTAKDKRVFGVSNGLNADILEHAKMSGTFGESIRNSDGVEIGRQIKPEYVDYLNTLISSGYKLGHVNSIGEGGINVCSENGNIDAGDYICSSNVKGKGMKQDDDILHSYTVAKALESVDWSTETSTTKMIACTYHCG